MKIGLAIELIRSTLKHFDHLKRHFFKGIWMIISKFNFKFTLFAIGYPSGYRVIVELFRFNSITHMTPFRFVLPFFFLSRCSPACSIDFMDLNRSLPICLQHFWPAVSFTYIQRCRSYLIAWLVRLKYCGNAFNEIIVEN